MGTPCMELLGGWWVGRVEWGHGLCASSVHWLPLAVRVCRGTLSMGCSTADGSANGFCPTASGAIRPCTPPSNAGHPFDPAKDPWGNRTGPGLQGFPCAVAPPRGATPAEGCAAGLGCFPLEGVVSYGLQTAAPAFML